MASSRKPRSAELTAAAGRALEGLQGKRIVVGLSGGALAIAVGDLLLMLQYATYSVISPEGCASILWRSADMAPEAAEALGITSSRLKTLGLIDRIVPEPLGGAHWDYTEAADLLRPKLVSTLHELGQMTAEERVETRIEKFGRMGFWNEVSA